MGYTKLFSEIIGSTVWREPDHVRLVWITMLACRDAQDTVQASIPGLADFARVPLDKCEDALARLSSPDPYSRTTTHEGRRIEKCDGGWRILNAEKYRKKMSLDERREYKRLKAREYRANAKNVDKNVDNSGQTGTIVTQKEEEEEKEEKKSKRERARNRASRLPEDWSLPEDWKTWATKEGHPSPEKAAARFRDYWIAVPGQKGLKRDWLATWRNWIRRDIEASGKKAIEARTPWQMSDEELMAFAESRNIQTKGKTRQQLINALR